MGMTQEKSDMLKELGMQFPPAWEGMYVKIVQYKAQHGVLKSRQIMIHSWQRGWHVRMKFPVDICLARVRD